MPPVLACVSVKVQAYRCEGVSFEPCICLHCTSATQKIALLLILQALRSRMLLHVFLGTLIRVFDAVNPGLIREFRRGADRAVVYSLAFSPDSQFLVASSDTGTVHVFALHHGVENRRSRFSMLSGMALAHSHSLLG